MDGATKATRKVSIGVTGHVAAKPATTARKGRFREDWATAQGRKPTVRLAHRAKRAIQIRINRRAMQWSWALSWVEKGARRSLIVGLHKGLAAMQALCACAILTKVCLGFFGFAG